MGRKKSRKRERLKPRPPAHRAITLTKKGVATSQLEAAMSLWFTNGDPASMLVLAFNAHGILHALAKKIGKASEWQVRVETMPRHFQARAHYVWNFCKHGAKDLDGETPYDSRHAEALMYFGGRCYRDLYGEPTLLMRAFDFRFVLENPSFARPEVAQAIAKLRDVYGAASISRQDFLHEYLPIIERGL